jgi:hypothetical protein
VPLPKLKFEQSPVESQGLFDVTDFERYVVETNGARFSCFSHGTLQQFVKDGGQTSSNTILSLIFSNASFIAASGPPVIQL